MNAIHKSFGITVRGIDLEKRCVDVVASTDAIDAHGEIVDQSWDLKRYSANPVVLYNHNVDADDPEDSLPIGYAENVKVVKGQLEATLCFVTEKANKLAELVWQGFVQKSLRAVSVGFFPRNIRTEMVDGEEVYRLLDNELFEISVCPMGSNPEAVRKAAEVRHQAYRLDAKKTAPAAETTDMNEAEIKALREEHTKALETERAAKAVAAKDAADARAALDATNKTLKALLAGQPEEHESGDASVLVAKAHARMNAEIKAMTDKLTEQEVDALIGVKITPAQKSAWLDLAKSSRKSFDSLLAVTPDLNLGAKVLGADPNPKSSLPAPATVAGKSIAGDDLAALADATN